MDQVDQHVYNDALITLYRQELISRYSNAALDHFADLEGLSTHKIQKLRQFFMDHLYPDVTDRPRRDAAFENLGLVLKSPKKLMPLMGNAISSVWKLGRQFPAAIKAGWRTLESYLESHRLEDSFLKQAQLSNLSLVDLSQRSSLQLLMRAIPPKEILRFRKNILLLFESLANVKLLRITLEIMSQSRLIMDQHPHLYNAAQKDGLDQGLAMLKGGLALFSSLTEAEVQLVLKGIQIIETRWYEQMIGENLATGF